MVVNVQSLILKCCSLGCVICAGGLWAGSEVDTRPKYRDEQTLVGGAIWSQVVIPLGLIISMAVEEDLYTFVHGYFQFMGSAFLLTTGIVLTIGEYNRLKRIQRSSGLEVFSSATLHSDAYDRVYLGIGLLCLLAGILTFVDFILIILL